MKKIKVMTVFGTRPEAIKMAPLVQTLAQRPEFESICCLTGQHREMLDSVMQIFRLTAQYDLNIMQKQQTLSSITTRALLGMEQALQEAQPDLVLVHGDTSTTFAGALAANAPMREAVRAAVAGGLPTVAECGGFLYLGRTLQDADGTPHPMAGVLPGQGFKVGRLVRFGYARLTARADSMLFRAGETLPVHEFHHWDSTENGDAFTAAKANGRQWACGFANARLYAGFPHLYWAGTPLPKRFAAAAKHYIKETS